MAARIIERIERTALFPSQGHPVHEYPEEPLREVHESPYRIIYGCSEAEFRVVTIVHFKQQLEKDRSAKPRSQ
jgi:plasmid stabilization system protein ParE